VGKATQLKWLAAGAVVVGIALAVVVFAIARETKVGPEPAVRDQAAALLIPADLTGRVYGGIPKPRPQTRPRRTPAEPKPCRRDKDDHSDRAGDDLDDETPADCRGTEGAEAEGEGRDEAGDDESRDGNDDEAGDSNGQGD
jgi:hypothetical protein